MPIYGSYKLGLICDTVDKDDACYRNFDFVAESLSDAIQKAKECGWQIDGRGEKCFCPGCVKKQNEAAAAGEGILTGKGEG